MIGSPLNYFDVAGTNPHFELGAKIGRLNSPFASATDALRDVIQRGQQFTNTMLDQQLRKNMLGYEYGLKRDTAAKQFDLRDDFKPTIDPTTGAVVTPKINATDQGIFITNDVEGVGTPVDRAMASMLSTAMQGAPARGAQDTSADTRAQQMLDRILSTKSALDKFAI